MSLQGIEHTLGPLWQKAVAEPVTRREMLCRSGMGFASLGLAGVLADQAGSTANAASVDGYSNPMLPKDVALFRGK